MRPYSSKLVIKQHLLPSVKWLLDQAFSVGQCAEIDLLFKDYSAINTVIDQLPSHVKLRHNFEECLVDASDMDMLILDEGGSLHQNVPPNLSRHASGVEQTTYGLQQNWNYPVVLVCRSAAKLFFESQIIARGIFRKLNSIDLLNGKVVGIIGMGALGSAVARELTTRGIQTIGTDIRPINKDFSNTTVTLHELLFRSDVVLGCAGLDVLAGTDINTLVGRKIFVSCSSSNIEFRTLLQYLTLTEKFGVASGVIGKSNCSVLNGGYPINFDRIHEWELFDEIILTRKLMLEGLIQAKTLIGSKPRGVMLNPVIQQKIVNEWLENVPDRDMLIMPDSMSEEFFRYNSEGEIQINDKPEYTLHSTTPSALTKMRSHSKQYETTILGLPILVLPKVWSPAYDWSSLFYIENMLELKGLDFLEIGCGTGVISVFAGRANAKRVVAVDVNEEAVKNTQLNFERFDIKNGETFLSDGFNNVTGKFDVVTWNAPYHGCKPVDVLERGCADEGYNDIRKFFQQVQNYLNPGGKVVFGFSESGDLPLIESLIAENGYRIKRKLSDWREDYNCLLFELVEAKR